jgi:sulfoxide reductase catalytic subunit YedY
MTLIRNKKSWEIPESLTIDEADFWNRRTFLRSAGLLGTSLLLHQSPLSAATAGFPTKRNPKYNLIEAEKITEEKYVTGYNNFYEFSFDKEDVKDKAKHWKTEPWSIEISGMVQKPLTLDVNELINEFGIEQRVYRFRCVEAWSMVVPWDGFPLKKLIEKAQPLSSAKFVKFISFDDPEEAPGMKNRSYPWPYTEGLRMDEAVHELTLMVTGVFGRPLPNQNGAPVRLMVPWKYGFKSIKSIQKIEFTDQQPNSLWNELAPQEYGFYANVNPEVDHPRWSQAKERPIGSWFFQKIPTQPFNGYAEEVASLYKGMDLKKNY